MFRLYLGFEICPITAKRVVCSLVHRRSNFARVRRMAKQIILDHSYRCRTMAETVNLLSKHDVVSELNIEGLPVHLVPNYSRGEVLIDARGRGSLQHG